MKRLTLVLLLTMSATAALANGTTPAPEPERATPEEMAARARAGNATAADLCNVPTSTPPAGYAADAKTWPCKNFSKS